MPSVQTPVGLADSLVYPAAPQTLIEAVAAARDGSGKPIRLATWGLGDVWIALGTWFLLSIVGSIAFVSTGGISTALGGAALLFATLLPWLGLGGWPLLITKIRGNGPRIDLGFNFRWVNLAWGFGYGILAIVVATIIAVITAAVFGEFSSAAGDIMDEISANKILLALFLPTVFIGAPIIEEICFRGLLFNSLGKRRLPPWASILITAAVFGVIHFEPVRFFLLFGIGVVLAVARWHTKSILTPIVAHMTLNFVSSVSLIVALFQ
jgi:membrane protease YdiL (CAAX protease family)